MAQQKEVAEAGKLYVVPTPVGNLDDMTVRAVEVLKSVDTILAEDTRTSGVLMKHFGITTKMQSHHKFNEHETAGAVVERLKSGERIALVSDAGTPAISDPGFMLVRECRRNGVAVECLPGATAFVPALVDSGLPTAEKRQGRQAGGIVEGGAHDDFLRIAVAACQDFVADGRLLRRRQGGERKPRNIEAARDYPPRYSCRACRVFCR